MIHQINIHLHIIAGILALLLGIAALLVPKYTFQHKRLGKYFLCLLIIVVTTGFVGWFLFRTNPFLLMLTLLSGYVSYAGWRAIRLKEKRSHIWDALVAFIALSSGFIFSFSIDRSETEWNPAVIYSTLGALVLVTIYDLLKYLWLYPYLKKWWIYEHIYKMISAFSALLSAFVGTILPDFKPFSQLGPSTFCILLIIWFIWREANKKSKVIGRSFNIKQKVKEFNFYFLDLK